MPVKRYTDVVEDFIRQVRQTSNLEFFGRGSKARSILEAFAAEVVAQSRLMESDLRQGRVSQATGKNLELIADLFNIQPIRRRRAFSPLGDLNVRFYVEPSVGVFGNLSTLPVINTGDQITAGSSDSAIIYTVTEAMGTLSPAASIYYVGVEALQSGIEFNVGSNSLINHPYGDRDLKVTNEFPITNGRNDETTEQLRFRIFNAIRSLETSNDRALFIAARITPGVGDVKILPRLFGIGTTAVVVRPTIGNTVPRSMVTAVRTSIDSVKPNSSRVIVTPPDLIGFELELRLNYSKPMTASEKTRIAGRVTSRLNSYFSVQGLGQSLSFADIASVVLGASGNIQSLGDNETALGRVYVYESDVPGDLTVRRRRELILNDSLGTYTVPGHSLAVLETSIETPIRIVHGNEG